MVQSSHFRKPDRLINLSTAPADSRSMKYVVVISMFFLPLLSAADESRSQIGPGRPYPARKVDTELVETNMSARRANAWKVFQRVIHPVRVAPGVAPVPRFFTWYDEDEFLSIFTTLFNDLTPEEKKARKPFDESRIQAIMTQKVSQRNFPARWSAHALEGRNKRNRFHKLPTGLKGPTFELFSPAFIEHYLRNYAAVEKCSYTFLSELPGEWVSPDPDNFSPCFDHEFPADAVMMKTIWIERGHVSVAFSTDDQAMTDTLAPLSPSSPFGTIFPAQPVDTNTLTPKDIFTMRTTEGKVYQLFASHMVTKEVRKWVWSTFWWSDKPTIDYGADRPSWLNARYAGWHNYKMCTTVDFSERDREPASHTQHTHPTLSRSIAATAEQMKGFTWCANPYLEGSFAKTNCIGCHQGAPTAMQFEYQQTRQNFPSDFVFSFGTFQNAIMWGMSENR
jgi:hypothetical protein